MLTEYNKNAVCKLIDYLCLANKCFTTGELTKMLREMRPDLSFLHRDLASFVRDQLWKYNSIYYDFNRAQRIMRYMDDGQGVYVYGPNKKAIESHDFVIEIPKFNKVFCPSNSNLFATLQSDGRMQVSKSALSKLGIISGHVYVWNTPSHAYISDEIPEDNDVNWKKYKIDSNKTRLRFKPENFDKNKFIKNKYPIQAFGRNGVSKSYLKIEF